MIRNIFLTIFVSAVLVVPAAISRDAASPRAVPGDSMRIMQTVRFSADDLQFRTVAGYDVADMASCDDCLDAVGKPMLPSLVVRVALPAGMRALSAGVVSSQGTLIDGNHTIFPAQPPRKTNGLEADLPLVAPDPAVYGSAAPYPSSPVELIAQTDLAGQGMAVVRINPLVYHPLSGRLQLLTDLTFTITGTGGYVCGDYLSAAATPANKAAMQSRIADLVINPVDVTLSLDPAPVKSRNIPAGGPYDHVLITTSELQDHWSDLVDWRTQRGFRSTVVTTDYIYANYGGSTNVEKVQAFVSDAYNTWGTEYFLIGGEHENVPFEYRTYVSESTPGDQCYSDFDDDWTHEVKVGRVTADREDEISRFIEKVLKYEKAPPRTDYPLDILLIGMDLDSSTPAEALKQIIDISYIPADFNVTKVYDSDPTNHHTDTINALNAGQNLVNHADHANWNIMGLGSHNHGWGLVNSDVNALVNDDRMSIVVSMGCHPNHSDGLDCIAERFVIHNDLQAGIAFTGNTRSGYYMVGSMDAFSCALDKKWWRALFLIGKLRLGDIHNNARNSFGDGGNTRRHCEWTFNLLGEPAMPVWTGTPVELDVTHPAAIATGPVNFTVTVSELGGAVEDALVCLWLEHDVYSRRMTGSDGTATFNISPQLNGDLSVTVTKQDYIPYEGTCVVGNGGGDPVVDIKINNSDGPLSAHVSETLRVKIYLEPNGWLGAPADWWVWAEKDYSKCWWCKYNAGGPTWTQSVPPIRFAGAQGVNVAGYTVFGPQPLPVAGLYDFYFAFDEKNGFLEETFIDSCNILIYN